MAIDTPAAATDRWSCGGWMMTYRHQRSVWLVDFAQRTEGRRLWLSLLPVRMVDATLELDQWS
jgi:hypothetical protein